MHHGLDAFDRELSEHAARRVRARFRRCWVNAACAVGVLGSDAYYVEGWVVVERHDPLVIEHGWCELDGRIVDPTYTPLVTDLDPPLAFYSGIRFDPREAALALHRRRLPIAWGQRAPEYLQAFERAWRDAATRVPGQALPKTRLVNCRREPFDVFIGRPSRWGNPFHIGRDGPRDEVIRKFRNWLIRQPGLLRDVRTLRGKVLGCDCPPRPCHGDVLAALADMAAGPGTTPGNRLAGVADLNTAFRDSA